MFEKVPPQIPLMSAAALAMLVAFFVAPKHVRGDFREQGEPPVASVPRAPEKPAVFPVANKVAQWRGLCSAYAATTVAGFKTQVMSDPQLLEHYRYFDWAKALIFENQEDSYSS